MCEGCYGLHFDSVSLVETVIENTWGIDDLPFRIVILGMTNEQRLGGECVWLNVHVSLR